jgi:hypothetical protein
VIRLGGFFLAGGALAFLGVFSYLAARCNYPAVLDGRAATVLPALLDTGEVGRLVWAIYALLPLIWIPAGVAASEALGRAAPGIMRLARQFALLAAIAMMLGLMRWPAMHWHLAQAWARADPAGQAVLAGVFDGLNTYLGNYIGEGLGELSFSLFFLLTSLAWFKAGRGARWVGWLGVVTAVAGFIGMFRNVTGVVAPVAAVNNYLLPLFMIVLGTMLARWREPETGGRDIATGASDS